LPERSISSSTSSVVDSNPKDFAISATSNLQFCFGKSTLAS
jgi:hypothetical protein